jgi:hypothetical protein
VALGQVTPGPVVLTVAVVGYSAGGVPDGLLAALIAFAPSFSFILLGAGRFERLLADDPALNGARDASRAPARTCSAICELHRPFTRSFPLGHKSPHFA